MIKKLIDVICEDLDIEVPVISYDTSKFLSPTMMAMCTDGIIYIKKYDKPNPDQLFSIAHELRHIWQMKEDKEFYLGNYKPRNEIDIESYNLQIAEVDANAYATIIMADCFRLKPLYHGMSNNVIAAIQERVKYIESNSQ